MGSEKDGDSHPPKIEEGTYSPSQPDQKNPIGGQNNTEEDIDIRARKTDSSFLKETFKGITNTGSRLETQLPVHTPTAITITITTIFLVILGWFTIGWLTVFGILSCVTGCYLLWLFQNRKQQPTPEERKEYVFYYGTAIIFLVIGVQYISQTW